MTTKIYLLLTFQERVPLTLINKHFYKVVFTYFDKHSLVSAFPFNSLFLCCAYILYSVQYMFSV